MEHFASSIVIIIIVWLGIFLLCRKIVLWYFKLDKIEQHLGDAVRQLKLLNGIKEESKPATFMDGLRKGIKD